MIVGLRSRVRTLKADLSLHRRFLSEARDFYRMQLAHNASSGTDQSKQKMEFSLLRENHVIEKGMSMRNPRKGFGVAKVTALIGRLRKYNEIYKDHDFLTYPIQTIRSYVAFLKSQGASPDDVEHLLGLLIQESGNEGGREDSAGITPKTKADIVAGAGIDFGAFARARHSIRYFEKRPLERELIEKALEIAQYTPSACNRQSWRTHVFMNGPSEELLKWQGGANGFEGEIPAAILVTADLNAFLHYEPYQAYVDGGLYAMSLMYALHSLGLGTIPLSTGFQSEKIRDMRSRFGVPQSEVPIVIIGTGHMLDGFNIATSKRKDFRKSTRFVS